MGYEEGIGEEGGVQDGEREDYIFVSVIAWQQQYLYVKTFQIILSCLNSYIAPLHCSSSLFPRVPLVYINMTC